MVMSFNTVSHGFDVIQGPQHFITGVRFARAFVQHTFAVTLGTQAANHTEQTGSVFTVVYKHGAQHG